jgi:hypothetical protein
VHFNSKSYFGHPYYTEAAQKNSVLLKNLYLLIQTTENNAQLLKTQYNESGLLGNWDTSHTSVQFQLIRPTRMDTEEQRSTTASKQTFFNSYTFQKTKEQNVSRLYSTVFPSNGEKYGKLWH